LMTKLKMSPSVQSTRKILKSGRVRPSMHEGI
jgi:hypothetical protein